MLGLRKRPKFVAHTVTYFYHGGTGMGDDREGYQCTCGWLVLGTNPSSRRRAKEHKRATRL